MTEIMTEDRKTETETLETLTERLETLLSEKDSGDLYNLESCIQLSEDIRETISGSVWLTDPAYDPEYFHTLDQTLERLRDLEIISVSGLTEDLEILDREIERLSYSIGSVSETPDLVYLLMTPKTRESLEIMTEDIYNPGLDTMLIRLDTVSDQISETQDQIFGYHNLMTEILDHIRKDPEDIRSMASIAGLKLSETLTDNLGSIVSRISETRIILLRLKRHIEDQTEDLETLTRSLKTETEIIKTRQKRLDLRISLTEDIETGVIISDMLRYNTGSSLLDSGMIYGYQYDRNKTRDLEREYPINIDPRYGYLDISISLYHFLTDCLEYDPVLDSLLSEIDSLYPDSRSWYQVSSQLIEDLEKVSEYDSDIIGYIRGIYCESGSVSFDHNTYNQDNVLDQDIQYIFFSLETDRESRVILQSHNGCDARGGYSRPRVMRLSDYDQTQILRVSDLYFDIILDPREDRDPGDYVSLYSDDSYHIYCDNDPGLSGSFYTFHTYLERDRIKKDQIRVSEKIQSIESIIKDLTRYTDPGDPANYQRVSDMLEILYKYRGQSEDLETEYRRVSGSLSINDLRLIDIEDWRDTLQTGSYSEIQDLYTGDPVILWRESDSDPSGYDLSIPGLGSFSVWYPFSG